MDHRVLPYPMGCPRSSRTFYAKEKIGRKCLKSLFPSPKLSHDQWGTGRKLVRARWWTKQDWCACALMCMCTHSDCDNMPKTTHSLSTDKRDCCTGSSPQTLSYLEIVSAAKAKRLFFNIVTLDTSTTLRYNFIPSNSCLKQNGLHVIFAFIGVHERVCACMCACVRAWV